MDNSVTEATHNRLPLHHTPLVPLNLGSVRAHGWLANRLQLQVDGLTGRAEEVIPELGPDNAWRGGAGEDWEKGPYYLRGLISLAFVHDDPKLVLKAHEWVDAILAGQQENGQIGPMSNPDWWPRMLVTWALRDYYEATGDERIIPALLRYSRYLGANLADAPLRDWARARAADQMDTLFWLYNRTGEAFLLDVADVLEKQANRWTNFFEDLRAEEGDYRTDHAVNISQAMKFPIVRYQRSGDDRDRSSFAKAWRNLRDRHGLAFGMWSGTEGLAGHADNQGVELCSIVEQMLSNAVAFKVLADPKTGDEQERIAFNLLAGATTKDFRQHQYYTLPNMPVARRNRRGVLPFDEDHGDDLLLSPHAGFHCCCYNLHMGWPKYVQYAWMATSDGGLAVVAHGPTTVNAMVKGIAVTISAQTDYPFEDSVTFAVTMESPLNFPFSIRVPGWCTAPSVHVNGELVSGATPGSFLRIDRRWQSGDVVVANFPCGVSVTTSATGAKTVWHGPLAFSLRIKEHVRTVSVGIAGFDEFELTPDTPWNYALELGNSGNSIVAETIRRLVPDNPWLPQTTPMRLEVLARQVDGWGLTAEDRLADSVPTSPVAKAGWLEKIELVPCGTQTLRIVAFPWTPSDAIEDWSR